MAAYNAVVSLLQTLDRRNPELFHGYTAETLDSLHASAEYFQRVLENISKSSRFDQEKIKSLEEKIRVAANEAEDVVELKTRQIIEELSWTFGILQHQDLLPVVEKVDTTKKQVMDILSHDADQILELSTDSLIDTSSKSYPMLSDELEEDIVQGIDDDLEIIVKRLTGPPSDSLEIVTISGMGGIGKTTLARKAYDQLAIRYHHFDILAWVTISQEFRFRNVLLEALHCISKKTVSINTKEYDEMDDNELADLVQKKLKGPRYLVVVDDIWNTDVWDSIRGIFPNYNNGSRVLLTTRETKVAMYANTSSPHEMSLLSLENGWKLLRDTVFGTKLDHPPELEEVGKEIVGKCQGLPLTISVIAGHLSKMTRTLGSWKDTARTLSEFIASHPDKCLGVLGLSYHHLPNHLKPCFLSMSSFPEDFEVENWRLIQLWIAEGFIRTSGSCKSLEDVAIVDYLEDLISRNLIHVGKRRFNGEMQTCGIHDLLREFCLIEAGMTKHMLVERTYHTLPAQKHNVRRFSFQIGSCSVYGCCKVLPSIARSIYLFSYLDPIIQEPFSRFTLLRVLAIFRINMDRPVEFLSFPLVITKLFHLRYLQLPFHVDIPESISELQNLQTLVRSGLPSSITLPVKIWTMKNLRCIRLRGGTYLHIPRGESLLNIEEFSGLSITSCKNEVFSGMPNLKRLIIEVPILRNINSPNGLMDMSSLRKLEVVKCHGQKKSPLYGISCSVIPISVKDFVFPTSLRRLSLNSCSNFIWEDISSTVLMLPNLEELKLKSCRADDHEWILTDKDIFRCLKLLLLSSLNLGRWEASSDNFPILKRLVLKDCDYLQEIPIDFGEIGTLESIDLHDCLPRAEDSAREIEQEQEYNGNNILKVYIHNDPWKDIIF